MMTNLVVVYERSRLIVLMAYDDGHKAEVGISLGLGVGWSIVIRHGNTVFTQTT